MVSPAREQYLELKREHPDAILLYRLGDFYEMFDRDAEIASKVLGIQLTARSYPRGEGEVSVAGVPHHSVDGYIKRLLDAGHRVAMCEQLAEAGKGLVERGVVRIFTSGTIVEPDMLQPGENNYLSAVRVGKNGLGLAICRCDNGRICGNRVFRSGRRFGPGSGTSSNLACGMSDAGGGNKGRVAYAHSKRDRAQSDQSKVLPPRRYDGTFKWHRWSLTASTIFRSRRRAVAAILNYLKHTNVAVLDLIQSVRSFRASGSWFWIGSPGQA